MTLFQTPLTAAQSERLRESFLDSQNSPLTTHKSPFQKCQASFEARPLLIGLLIFLNTTAAGILLKLILS